MLRFLLVVGCVGEQQVAQVQAVCGDGVVFEGVEDCDDGNLIN